MELVEAVGGEAAGVGGDKEGEVVAAWMSINAVFLFVITGTHLILMYVLFSYQCLIRLGFFIPLLLNTFPRALHDRNYLTNDLYLSVLPSSPHQHAPLLPPFLTCSVCHLVVI